MLLRNLIIVVSSSIFLGGCAGPPGLFGAGTGLLAGPVKCAEKASKDKDSGFLDYLKVPGAILFGPFVGAARELEMPIGSGPSPQERIRYIADVCDNRTKEEYFKALAEEKAKEKTKGVQEEKKEEKSEGFTKSASRHWAAQTFFIY